jgi:hypothetical protein
MQAHVTAISTDVINLNPEQAGSTAPWYVGYLILDAVLSASRRVSLLSNTVYLNVSV